MADDRLTNPTYVWNQLDYRSDAIVEASAGTGKTYALESIVLKLLCDDDKRYDARNILLVTFTEKAAGELKNRIRRTLDAAGRLPPDFDEMTICTIHSFCRQLLSEYAFENGVPMQYETAGDCDALALRAVRESLADPRFAAACPDGLYAALSGADVGSVGSLVERTGAQVSKGRLDRLRRTLHATEAKAAGEVAAAYRALCALPCVAEIKRIPARAGFKTGTAAGAAAKAFFEWLAGAFDDLAAPESPAFADCLGRFPAGTGAAHVDPALVSWDAQAIKKGTLFAQPGMTGCKEPLANLVKAIKALAKARSSVETGSNRSIRRTKLLLALGEIARPRFEALKESASLLTFDDMVSRAAAVVTRSPGTDAERDAQKRFFDSVRTRYRVALVDEFQDTDDKQWGIFRTLFAATANKVEGGKPGFLIVVGDPKQAIYGFRGADVRVYGAAQKAIVGAGGIKKSLLETFRAKPALVEAFNKLFGGGWFAGGAAGEGIGYDAVSYPARGNRRFGDSPPDGGAGLEEREPEPVLLLESMPRRAAPLVSKNVASFGDAAACLPVFMDRAADEMKYLVGLDWAWRRYDKAKEAWEERRFRYGDMCVLVRTNDDAAAARRLLARHGIPCGQYNQRGLFDSPEAEGLLALFDFLESPSGRGHRAALLLSPLFGVHPSELASADGGEAFRAFVERLQVHARKRAWSELFETVLSDPCTALSSPGADANAFNRTRAAVRQLFDRLLAGPGRRAATIADFAAALRAWRKDDKLAGDDAERYGKESDADRVQIMTMHAAKGLEFPVVFVAAGFAKADVRGTDEDEKPALREEFRRLFYVALTRAMFRIYLPWSERAWTWKVPIEEEEKDETGKPVKGPDGKTVRKTVEKTFSGLGAPDSPLLVAPDGDAGFLGRAIKAYFAGREDATAFPPPRPASPGVAAPVAAPAPAAAAPAPAAIPDAGVPRDLKWFASLSLQWDSFSSLSRSPAKDADPRREAVRTSAAGKEGGAEDEQEEAGPAFDLRKSLLPGGRVSGNAFHEIMESLCKNDEASGEVGFTNACDAGMEKDDSPLADLVRRKMRKFSIRNRTDGEEADADSTEKVLLRMVRRALDTEIDVGGISFKLRDVRRGDRLAEMDFVGSETAFLGLPDTREGALNGAIDLLVRVGGKVFIVDGKTNMLRDYGPTAVEAAMDEAGYRRQYRLYALAAGAWLEGHGLPLAGAAYLFVRGGEYGAASAVFSEAFDEGSLGRFRAEIASIPAFGADKEDPK